MHAFKLLCIVRAQNSLQGIVYALTLTVITREIQYKIYYFNLKFKLKSILKQTNTVQACHRAEVKYELGNILEN